MDLFANSDKWLDKSRKVLQKACSPYGIKASLQEVANYRAVFTRDAVLAGIAGLLIKDEDIITGFIKTIQHLKYYQGQHGQIASNYMPTDHGKTKISYGTLGPKLDACTLYLVGVGLLIKNNYLQPKDYEASVKMVVDLLATWEYNDKNLFYVPKGGNWADEYVYHGYILYDQILRVWGLQLVGEQFGNSDWVQKAKAIRQTLVNVYYQDQQNYYTSSIYPGGKFEKFDLAAHSLFPIIFNDKTPRYDHVFDWIDEVFISKGTLPPAFHPPITPKDGEWDDLQDYHLYQFRNHPHQYHNGGIWWIWLGWLATAYQINQEERSLKALINLINPMMQNIEDFKYSEYLYGNNIEKEGGTTWMCYTATGIIHLILAAQSFDFSILKAQNCD